MPPEQWHPSSAETGFSSKKLELIPGGTTETHPTESAPRSNREKFSLVPPQEKKTSSLPESQPASPISNEQKKAREQERSANDIHRNGLSKEIDRLQNLINKKQASLKEVRFWQLGKKNTLKTEIAALSQKALTRIEELTKFEKAIEEHQKKEAHDLSPEGMTKNAIKVLEGSLNDRLVILDTYREAQKNESKNLTQKQKTDDEQILVNDTYTRLMELRGDLARLQEARLSEEQKETILEQRIKGLETYLQDWKKTRDQIPKDAQDRRNSVGEYMNGAYNDLIRLRLTLAEEHAKKIAIQAESDLERKNNAA